MQAGFSLGLNQFTSVDALGLELGMSNLRFVYENIRMAGI